MRDKFFSDILLVGQPNVGKSVLFSRLTGIKTIASNYAGTTVTYTSGEMDYDGGSYKVIDAPGTYSLEPLDDAARLTIDLIDDAKIIVNVIDSTHLERNLSLTFELLAQKKPVIIVLNMSDEARHKGILIDVEKLSNIFGVPVVQTVARTGEGVKDLIDNCLGLMNKTIVEDKKIKIDIERPVEGCKGDSIHRPGCHPHIPSHEGLEEEALAKDHVHIKKETVWEKIGKIICDVQKLKTRKHNFTEILEDLTVHPVFGLVFALGVLIVSFSLVRLIGEFFISGGLGIVGEPWFTLPFGTEFIFEKYYLPLMESFRTFLGSESFLSKLLVGSPVDGKIDLVESFGLLTSGIFIPLGVVLPYVISFYFMVSVLEDTGYLPRLAIFLDGVMHKIGLHGYAVIPTILGFGCNVPGILATRILETKQQRFIVATLISIAVPCVALQAMIIGVLGKRGLGPLLVVYGTLLAAWFIVGFVLKFFAQKYRPELLIEIPPYRLPDLRALFSKMWIRTLGFVKEALPIVMFSILVVDLLYISNIFVYIADFTAPLVNKLWGMPKESIAPLLIGILRKDAAVAMFPSSLTTKQLVTGCVVLSMFFPCAATFVVLVKELGFKYASKSILVMFIAVVIAGALINLFY
jgi:ferrous iron transport protein B